VSVVAGRTTCSTELRPPRLHAWAVASSGSAVDKVEEGCGWQRAGRRNWTGWVAAGRWAGHDGQLGEIGYSARGLRSLYAWTRCREGRSPLAQLSAAEPRKDMVGYLRERISPPFGFFTNDGRKAAR
jgi:hypothetical protein